MDKKWRWKSCPNCGGRGIVSVYSQDDFEGPGSCPECGGEGIVWISPKDRVADYPGGPFRGSWPGAYETAEEVPDA